MAEKSSFFASPKLVNPVVIGAKTNTPKTAAGGDNSFVNMKPNNDFKNIKPTSEGGVKNATPPKGNVVKEAAPAVSNRPSLAFGKGFVKSVPVVSEKKLTSKSRNNLPDSDFVIKGQKGKKSSRKYPIPDESHARNALSRSAGTPEQGKVRAAVTKKFPGIKVSKNSK